MKYILISPKIKLDENQLKKIKSISKNTEIKVAKNENEVKKLIPGAEIFLTYPAEFPMDFSTEMAPNLKWVHTMSAGAERFASMENTNTILTNSSGVHAVPIVEHVIGMILSFERNLHLYRDNQLQRKWVREDDANLKLTELKGKTVCVVGLGDIGLRLCKILKAFETKIVGVKRSAADKPDYVDQLFTADRIKEALAGADYVVLCIPHTKETYRMFGPEMLKSMKKGSVLINIGRGGIVDENALIKSINDGHLRGAGLDVFEKEPLPEQSPLYGMKDVIITPHVSGSTPHYIDRAIEIFCNNIKAYPDVKKMSNIVDKKKGY